MSLNLAIIVFHFVDIQINMMYLVPVSYVKFQSKSLHTFQFLAESQNLVLMDVLQQVDFLLSPAIENYKNIMIESVWMLFIN